MKQLIANCEETRQQTVDQNPLTEREMCGDESQSRSEENSSFVVKDAASANWVVKKIVQAREYAERVEAWAALELRRAKREEEFFTAHYREQLSFWLKTELAKRRPGMKCVKLLAGTIGFRKSAEKLYVADKAALVAWCDKTLLESKRVTARISGSDASKARIWLSRNCSVVHFQDQPAISEVSQWAATTGELSDGTSWQPCRDKLYVK